MEADRINLQSLAILAEVERCGSFAAAAHARGVDSSIISRSIANLEKAVGFTVFERTTRRLRLTEAGKTYLERVRLVLDDLEAARLEALDQLTSPSGKIRVTTSSAFGQQWLVPKLAVLMQTYPNLSVDIILSDAEIDLAAEGIDLAIRLTSRPKGSWIATKLMDTRFRVVASGDYLERHAKIAHPENLNEHQCVLLSLPGYRSLWRFRSKDNDCAIGVGGRVTLSSPAAVRAAALAGMGPTLLADWMVDDDIAQGRLVDLLPDWEASAADFGTAAWILYPSRNYLPLKVRIFIEFLRNLTIEGK